MINLLVKSLTVIGSCGGLALVSTIWAKPENTQPSNKVDFGSKEKTVTKIKRVEEVDVWGQENGCSFVFVKDFSKNEIYTATDYAKENGGKDKDVGGYFESKRLEDAIVNTVNKHKDYCLGETKKLKTFTFLWSPIKKDFYIGDPAKHTESEQNALKNFISKNLFFWTNTGVRRP